MPKAYLIAFKERTVDPDEIAKYAEKAMPTLTGATPVVVYGRMTALEGAPAEGVAVFEFPSYDEALAWYNSDAYQDSVKHRRLGADCRLVIAEGVD